MTLNETRSFSESEEEIGIEKWLEIFEQKYKMAEKIAEDIGEVIVGRVSPFEEVKIGLGNNSMKLIVELDKYLERKDFIARPNTILAAVDIATLRVVSLRVLGVVRADLYSRVGGIGEALVPYPYRPDLRGLLSRPQIIAEPLLEFEYNDEDKSLKSGKSSSLVIEPRSPVVIPKPKYIEALLDIPTDKENVPIGALTIGEEPYIIENNIATLRVPLGAFFSHVFIAGTTGSGKTTFVKNILKALLLNNAAVACVDDNGDYIQAVLDPVWEISSDKEKRIEELIAASYGGKGGLESITIVLPLTKSFVNSVVSQRRFSRSDTAQTVDRGTSFLIDLAVAYCDTYLKPQAKRFFPDFEVGSPMLVENYIVEIPISFTNSENVQVQRSIKIVPYCFEFEKIKEKVAEIYPYFTDRAREKLENLIRRIDVEEQVILLQRRVIRKNDFEDFDKFVQTLTYCFELNKRKLAEELKMHPSTLENMINGLQSLKDMGIFDIKINELRIPEPDISNLISSGKLTVLDLRVLEDLSAKRLLTFRFLNRVHEWKREHLDTSVVVVIDEAHRFFPKTVAPAEQEYIQYVTSAIEKIARLGRVRRLGLIISTHSPKDVHDIVLNLCNSKVIFRLDPAVIDVLDLPREYRDLVTRVSDRIGLFKSSALRLHYAVFKTSLPVVGHFKERAV